MVDNSSQKKTNTPEIDGNSPKKKFSWETLKVLASLLMPLAIASVGHWYTSALKEREIQTEYIELAISILREEPSESNLNVREWAVDIINEYSPVEVNKATRDELMGSHHPLARE